MLLRQVEPVSLYDQHRTTRQRMDAFYQDAININMSFWSEADANQRFETGDSTIFSEWYGNLPAGQRRQFTCNHIRRICNMIGGYQRRNRKSTICIPLENGDAKTADQFTKVLNHINLREGVLETISMAFHKGALVSGMNLLQVYIDYREDPISGNIKVNHCDYNSFLIDPYFKKADLSDCNAIWKRSWMTKEEAISLLPEHEDAIMSLQYNNSQGDGKFQFMSEQYNYGMRNLITYDEYYYRSYRKQKLLVDINTGETKEWRNKDPEMLKLFLFEHPEIQVVEQDIPTVKLAISVQNQVLYDGQEPHGLDCYPFVPVFGYYNPQLPYFPQRCQSVVSNLRDPQYLYNRRLIIELDMMESMATSGYKFKENALVNPMDVYTTGQGRGIAIKEEAQMSDVEQIQPVVVPPANQAIRENLGKEIVTVSGANEELMGSAIDDKAGVLAMLRQGAGLTTLQILFDQLDFAQKCLGKIELELIQLSYTPGKIQNILENEQPTEQFYNKAFGVYHCAIEEGLNTTSQKQMQLMQMLQLREAGIPIDEADILDATTFQGKDKVMENMKKKLEQQSQAQNQQIQIQMMEQQARIENLQAQSKANVGLGYERLSRIQENESLAIERKAAAVKDENAALLDLVKAMKELDTIEISHLKDLIAMSHSIKDKESADEEARSQVTKQQGLSQKIMESQSAKQPQMTQGNPEMQPQSPMQ